MIKTDEKQTEKTREVVLEAALKRFAYFGYKKTTMAEIAGDCDMSAANLYRFFRNKADIATELALQHFEENHREGLALLEEDTLSAGEKLKKYAMASLEGHLKLMNEMPMLSELVEFVNNERTDLVTEKIKQHREIIARIIEQGNGTGEFNVSDPGSTAEYFRVGLAVAHFPDYIVAGLKCCFDNNQEEYRKAALGVVNLLINGLK